MKNNIKELIKGEYAVANSRIVNAHVDAQLKIERAKKAFTLFHAGVLAQAKTKFEELSKKITRKVEKIENKYMTRKQKLAVKALGLSNMEQDIGEVESTIFEL